MEVHAAEAAGGAPVAGDEHVEAEPHGGEFGLVGAPGRRRTAAATVEKAGTATEDD
jgi:hypothetical protein